MGKVNLKNMSEMEFFIQEEGQLSIAISRAGVHFIILGNFSLNVGTVEQPVDNIPAVSLMNLGLAPQDGFTYHADILGNGVRLVVNNNRDRIRDQEHNDPLGGAEHGQPAQDN